MSKIIKNAYRQIIVVLDLLLLFYYLFVFCMQFTYVQTKSAQWIAAALSHETGIEIGVKKVRLEFFHRVVLEDLFITDLQKDSLLFVSEIDVGFDSKELIQLKLRVSSLCLTKPIINLYKEEGRTESNFSFLSEWMNTEDTNGENIRFFLNHLEIIDGQFRYHDNNIEKKHAGFDPFHINAHSLNLYLNDLSIENDLIRAQYCKLSVQEKSFYLEDLTCTPTVSSEIIDLRDLHLLTEESQIHGHFSLQSETWDDYKDFMHKVSFKTRILPSDISIDDLSYFVPDLKGMRNIPHFKGNFSGTIADLAGKDVQISLNDHSFAHLDLKLKGLPNIEETYFYFDFEELRSSKNGIERIQIPPFSENQFVQLPKNFASLGAVHFKGRLSGYLNNILAEGLFKTNIGEIETDLAIKNEAVFSYSGKIQARKFDAGKFFDSEEFLGKVSLTAQIKGEGLDKSTVNASIDGKIQEILLNNYTYHDVKIKGQFKKEMFLGSIAVKDKYIELAFDGNIDLSKKEMLFDFKADIRKLYPRIVLGVEHIDSSAWISTNMKIDIKAKNLDQLYGELSMKESIYEDKDIRLESNGFSFISSRDQDKRSMAVRSDIFDFSLDGKYDVLDGFKSFKRLLNAYFPNLEKESHSIDKDFKFNALIKDYSLLEKFVTPGMWLDSGSMASGRFISANNYLDVHAKILGLKKGLLLVDTASINIFTDEEDINLITRISNYSLGGSTKERIIELDASANNNEIVAKLNSYGKDSSDFSSDLTLVAYLKDYNSLNMHFEQSNFTLDSNRWNISDSNYIALDSGSWTFNRLNVLKDDQILGLNGRITYDEKEALILSLTNFNLNFLNSMMSEMNLSLEGIINGEASFKNIYRDVLFESNLTFENLVFNEKDLGNGHIISIWEDESKSLSVDGKLTLKGLDELDLRGQYNSNDAISPLNFDLTLKEIPLTILEPFTVDILSNFRGSAFGVFQLRGTLNDPKLSGLLNIREVGARVDYTNVTYDFKNANGTSSVIPVKFTPDSIIVPAFSLIDEFSNTGLGSVAFVHNGFKKFETDLNVSMKNLFTLNTTVAMNDLFYGKAFVTGDIGIFATKGFSKINLDIETDEKTRINLPIDDISEINEVEFIVFEESEELKKLAKEEVDEKEAPLNLELNMKLKATKDALVRIVFDEATGDVIETRGVGDLLIKYDPKNSLSMYGQYEIVDGTYMFTLQSIVNKKFNIMSGSRIKWSGDPYKGEMDITTAYSLRARLYDILPEVDQDVNYKRKIPVELRLKLTESIESPIVGFNVYLPESKESIRGQLQAELSNESCLNRQVFSLLILSSFSPCEAKETNTASTNVGKTTAYEAMSNQLSGWLSQISDDFDIGVSYQPEIDGEEYSSEQVEVALSTQFFNDRLILDGNVGYGNQRYTSQNTKDWAGEFTVEYKIREDGRLRVKAFNKVNDRSYIENDNLYIQGVGLSYSRDFGSIWGRALRRRIREEERGE